MTTALDPDAAARLKDEGNKHYEKKEFSQACDKYTAALKKGGDNAIIYANRAACLLGQRKFLDAINDAQKATEVDSTYAKGWGRLASAYMGVSRGLSAKDAYQKAIGCLQGAHLTPAQLKQRKLYEDGLREAEELSRPRKAELHTVSKQNVKYMPWQQGVKMLNELNDLPVPTSAWIIGMAYREWDEGMKKLRLLRQSRLPGGVGMKLEGAPDAITCLTNAILRDRRVFHTSEKTWEDMFRKQANYEIQLSNGWVNEGPKIILEQAQARVKRDGWDETRDAMGHLRGGVRQAMGSQVRIWIMQAFVLNGLKGDSLGAEALYSNILDFLENGRKIWANVPSEDRGTIFSETFIRGIRVLHLETYMTATVNTMKGKYTLKKLSEVAKSLFNEASNANENRPPVTPDSDTGFFASFCDYPIGEALMTMALCLNKGTQSEGGEEKRKEMYKKAGQLYYQSTKYFFEDDEYYCQTLTLALSCYWKSGAGLDVTLDIMKALKKARPKMMKIWAQSALSQGQWRDRAIELCLNFYEEVSTKISRGELTKDAMYIPDEDVLLSI